MAPIFVLSLIPIRRGSLGSREGQQVCVRHKWEAPTLHDVSADGIVCTRVVDARNVLLRQDVHVQLVAQLFFTQNPRYEMLSEILHLTDEFQQT